MPTIRQFSPSRRQRLARNRAVALAVIGAVAASGAVLQEAQRRADRELVAAATPPGAYDYFPG